MKYIITPQRHYLRKIINCQRGGLLTLAAILSTFILTGCTSIVGMSSETFIGGVPTKDVMMPVVIEIFGVIFYLLFLVVDFGTGVWAAKKASSRRKSKDSVIRADKLYRTFWKLLGVLLLTGLIGTLGVFASVIYHQWAYKTLMWVQIVILVAACLYEFQSIGENIKKATGTKPAIFDFIGVLFTIFRRRVVDKVAGASSTEEENKLV